MEARCRRHDGTVIHNRNESFQVNQVHDLGFSPYMPFLMLTGKAMIPRSPSSNSQIANLA
jgi:hypothetical protein